MTLAIPSISSNLEFLFKQAIYHPLFVQRGAAGADMTTDSLYLVVKRDQAYRFGDNCLELTHSPLFSIDLEERVAYLSYAVRPDCLEIEAKWDATAYESGSANNILGDNGYLIIADEQIEIPCMEATADALAYYGALLIQVGDVIQFPNEEYPIFEMHVGDRYTEEFLMSKEGGGFYLEYHHDKPHFHMPIEGGGYYLLARWNDDRSKLCITGFKIPDGKAVYTKKGVIHCDAALTGKLIVGYDKAEDCSTVLLRTYDGKRTQVKFREI